MAKASPRNHFIDHRIFLFAPNQTSRTVTSAIRPPRETRRCIRNRSQGAGHVKAPTVFSTLTICNLLYNGDTDCVCPERKVARLLDRATKVRQPSLSSKRLSYARLWPWPGFGSTGRWRTRGTRVWNRKENMFRARRVWDDLSDCLLEGWKYRGGSGRDVLMTRER